MKQEDLESRLPGKVNPEQIKKQYDAVLLYKAVEEKRLIPVGRVGDTELCINTCGYSDRPVPKSLTYANRP